MNKINRCHECKNGIAFLLFSIVGLDVKRDIDKFIGHPSNYGKQKILLQQLFSTLDSLVLYLRKSNSLIFSTQIKHITILIASCCFVIKTFGYNLVDYINNECSHYT